MWAEDIAPTAELPFPTPCQRKTLLWGYAFPGPSLSSSPAVMSNFTVDDTDLGILYLGNTSEQCIGVCLGAGWDGAKLYDGTVTIVQEQSMVAHYSFAGTAIYVYFSAPANTVGTTQNAVFLVDGENNTQQVSTFQIPPTQSGNYSILVYSLTMEDGYHVITIFNGNFALDYLIYTSNGTPIITDSAPTQPSSTSSSQTSSTFLPSSPVVSSSSLSSTNSFSLTSSSSLSTTSAADSQAFRNTRKTPVSAIAGASVASAVVALGVLVALLLYCRARKPNITAPANVDEPKYTSPVYLVPPPVSPSGSGAAPSPSNTMEEQLRQLQAEVEQLRVDPWGARNSAISGSGDTASVTRSLSTMKSEQTRALLGQSYDHSTVRDSYLQTDGGLSLRAERDPDVAGPPRYE
ncbi:hypothetical protein C8R47DRAFT_563496 [Mycena vitilis]|nr:hypothetical protein C8R47DRAFT_563496 [Mycena vitilis]